MTARRSFVALATVVVILAGLCLAAPAFAYDEPNNAIERHNSPFSVNCQPCHRLDSTGVVCNMCHPSHGKVGATAGKGPHGLYTASTNRCSACHTTHVAGGAKLLAATTVTDSCYSCHDGTGGRGVYGSFAARGLPVGGSHSFDATNVVPGGDGATGGSKTMTFKGIGGNLGCGDCHSPHDQNTVAAYKSDRHRVTWTYSFGMVSTSHLLRQNPGGSTATATVYGSDWCLTCHAGRSSGGAAHNHPVDSLLTTSAPFSYSWVALLANNGPTSVTVTGAMSFSNRGFLMPYPRTPQQNGHAPICQQCHSNSRQVGTLTTASATAAPFSIVSTDGNDPADNPRFQNFPHETANANLLVETNDDLCLNCHPADMLP